MTKFIQFSESERLAIRHVSRIRDLKTNSDDFKVRDVQGEKW